MAVWGDRVLGDCGELLWFRPTPLAYRVEAGPLPDGMAARLIRAFGETEVQVSDVLPRRLHRTIARHTLEAHGDACTVVSCVAARTWLRAERPIRLVETAAG